MAQFLYLSPQFFKSAVKISVTVMKQKYLLCLFSNRRLHFLAAFDTVNCQIVLFRLCTFQFHLPPSLPNDLNTFPNAPASCQLKFLP